MLPKTCLRRLNVSTQTAIDGILENLNHKELTVGGNRDSKGWFQLNGTSLSNYSLFSKIEKSQKLELIVNESAMNPQMNRAIGCMYGMAIGDSVGAPLEFLDATKSIIYGSAMDDPFMSNKSWFDLKTGDYARLELLAKINQAVIPAEVELIPEPYRMVVKACLIKDVKYAR